MGDILICVKEIRIIQKICEKNSILFDALQLDIFYILIFKSCLFILERQFCKRQGYKLKYD